MNKHVIKNISAEVMKSSATEQNTKSDVHDFTEKMSWAVESCLGGSSTEGHCAQCGELGITL